jgi:serine protease
MKMKTRIALLMAIAIVYLYISESGHSSSQGDLHGSYIVVLKEQPAEMRAASELQGTDEETVATLSTEYGGEVENTFDAAINGYVTTMSEAQAELLAQDPRVAFVEPDREVELMATQQNVTWGLDRVDQRSLPVNRNFNYELTGAGVTAYILDSGIRPTHTEFEGRAEIGADFVEDGMNGVDCNGHGTHVAATIGGKTYGVAKGVKLVSVRVIGCTKRGPLSAVLKGIDWIAKNHSGPSVVNMSVGIPGSPALDGAVKGLISTGVTVVGAAGNHGADACFFSPSRVPEMITVGATNMDDLRPEFSNYGKCVDLFAPGDGIMSAWINSDQSSTFSTGTSMSSPHVVGVAAMYLEKNGSATPAEVGVAITEAATRGVVLEPGVDSPNRLLYAGFDPPAPPAPMQVVLRKPLVEGWNMISFPIDLTGKDIGTVLKSVQGRYSIIYGLVNGRYISYSPDSSSNELTELSSGAGYWIYMNEGGRLDLKGPIARDSIKLSPGWNLVGYNGATPEPIKRALASFPSVEYVYTFDSEKSEYIDFSPSFGGQLTTMSPGTGYFLYSKE